MFFFWWIFLQHINMTVLRNKVLIIRGASLPSLLLLFQVNKLTDTMACSKVYNHFTATIWMNLKWLPPICVWVGQQRSVNHTNAPHLNCKCSISLCYYVFLRVPLSTLIISIMWENYGMFSNDWQCSRKIVPYHLKFTRIVGLQVLGFNKAKTPDRNTYYSIICTSGANRKTTKPDHENLSFSLL